MPKYLFNQDRTEIVEFSGELFTMPVIFNDKEKGSVIMGINLYTKSKGKLYNLGTFDSIAESMKEIDKIHRTKYECYLISSFDSSFRDWNVLKQLMQEVD